MASLASLPTELVQEMAAYLEVEDFLHLRETCRAIADKTFQLFQDSYFYIRAVMLEQQSMQNLVDISHHPVLRHAVEEVQLCVDHLVEPKKRQRLEATGSHRQEIIEERYEESWKDMTDSLNRTINTIQLAKALSQFPNCKRIGVGNRFIPWGAARLSRRIDAFWHSDRDLPIPTDIVLHEEPSSKIHALFCIRTLISAICWSRKDVKEIYISFGCDDEDSDCAFPLMLVLPLWLQIVAKQHLTMITTVSILVGPKTQDDDIRQSRELASNDPVRQVRRRPRFWHADLQSFLDIFTSLSELTITAPLPWVLSQPTGFYAYLQIPHLRILTLEHLECTTEEILELLRRHQRTLSKLTLSSVGLFYEGPGSWVPVVRALCDDFLLERLDISGCVGHHNGLEYQVPYMLYIRCDEDEESDSLAEVVKEWEEKLMAAYEAEGVADLGPSNLVNS